MGVCIYKRGKEARELVKVLVTGAGGQLGRELVQTLACWHDVRGLTRAEWDVTQFSDAIRWIKAEEPETLIHCAAYTDVDGCEENPRLAYDTHAAAAYHLASICGRHNIRLVYISTDYVFDGTRQEGYLERDSVRPINVYGKTKWMGERWVAKRCPRHLIVRTSWLYGHEGHHFPGVILERARQGAPLQVVTDQVGCPTYTRHLAQGIQRLLETKASGIFHLAGSGSCSWYEFARTVLSVAGIDQPVLPITSDQLKRKAPRPACSILRTERGQRLPHWREGVCAYLSERWEGST